MSKLVILYTLLTLISLTICTKTNEGTTKANNDGGATMAPTTANSRSSDSMPTINNSKSMADGGKSMADDTKSMADDTKSMTDDTKSMSSEENDLDLMSVMTMCNDSFRIEMSYLLSLNESGSFPDETDQTPKCYLRCVLQSMNVASLDNGAIDAERAAVVFAGTRNGEPMGDITDITSHCARGRDETNKCEMAYNFLKCLFSMEIEKYAKS